MSNDAVTVERASSTDVMELVCDVSGTSMQVAAALIIDSRSGIDVAAVRTAIADRIIGIPRLRQRLTKAPFGCGRPFWTDDPAFDVRHHCDSVGCPAPGDEQAMLEVIAGIISRRLPTERPLWKATLITGVPGGRTVLVVVFHHVLADGIGGLAMLAQLMDGMPPVAAPTFPHRPPQRRDLIRDALRYRLRAVGRLPAAVARLRTATAELGTADSPDAPRCSLNHPIGSRRALAVARVDLDVVRAAAHAHGGTVNDVVLTAVAGGVGTVLAERGEELDRLVISMPVSARRQATTTELGNQVGVIRVAIPTTGEPVTRLTAVAGITRPRKFVKGGTSAALIAPVFRLLAKAGIFGWFVNRQHLVNTFVSNLRGPEHALSFLGLPVGDIIPISMISGNVTVAFTALSYAGTLNITVVADPEQCPDFSRMAGAIQAELQLLTGVPV